MKVLRRAAWNFPSVSEPAAVRLALLVYGAALALIVTAGVIWITIHRPLPRAQPVDGWLTNVAWGFAFTTLGVVLARRRPKHPVGWLLLGAGFLSAAALLGEEVVAASTAASGNSTTLELVALLSDQAGQVVVGMLAVIMVVFPTGRPPTRAWWALVWVILAWTIGVSSVRWFENSDIPGVGNPLGFPEPPSTVAWLDDTIAWTLGPVMLIGGLAAVPTRFIRARGIERQQLKVFLYAVVVTVALFAAPEDFFLYALLGETAVSVRWSLPAVGVAAGVTVAILRHGLYDIDRLISRTLVYAGLTALLGLVYVVAVLIAGQLFGGVANDPPAWGVAGATLVVAGLFQPARQRMQGLVDRRFNRRRFDSARTVEAFSARLRDEVDLRSLYADLTDVVTQTVQPTTVALWLRTSGRQSRRV